MGNDAYHNMDANTQAAIHDNYISEQEREYKKCKELISKFTDGWSRYSKEPLFRNILEALVRGADPYEIISKLIEMNDEISGKYRELLTKQTLLK